MTDWNIIQVKRGTCLTACEVKNKLLKILIVFLKFIDIYSVVQLDKESLPPFKNSTTNYTSKINIALTVLKHSTENKLSFF